MIHPYKRSTARSRLLMIDPGHIGKYPRLRPDNGASHADAIEVGCTSSLAGGIVNGIVVADPNHHMVLGRFGNYDAAWRLVNPYLVLALHVDSWGQVGDGKTAGLKLFFNGANSRTRFVAEELRDTLLSDEYFSSNPLIQGQIRSVPVSMDDEKGYPRVANVIRCADSDVLLFEVSRVQELGNTHPMELSSTYASLGYIIGETLANFC
jgi:hypothetical protein